MKKSKAKDSRKHPFPIRIPWGITIGFLGILFGAGVWAVQTLQPGPEEDPNWVPLTEVQALEAEVKFAKQKMKESENKHKTTQRQLEQVKNSQRQIQADLKRSIPIQDLPTALQAPNAQLTANKIKRLYEDSQSGNDKTMIALLQVLSQILETGLINTNQPADNKETKALYQSVQTILQITGNYQGSINGDQKLTYQALTDFQKTHKLKVDGKMGMKTFGAIAEKFKTEISKQKAS